MTDTSRALPPGGVEWLTRIALGQVGRGLSSKALALYAIGMNDDLMDDFGGRAEPCDPSDLRRCFQDYELAPPLMQTTMRPILEAWTVAVFGRHLGPEGTAAEVAAYVEQAHRIGGLPAPADSAPGGAA